MTPVSPATLESFAAAARKCAAYGLMKCSSGNMSFRLDEQHILVKASRSWMSDLMPDDIAICRLADGTAVNGKKPSVEIGFHAGVLRTRPDVNVVLHFQSPAATTLACRRDLADINFFVIPEVAYYIGPIGIVPYIFPGTPQLAEAVVATMANHNLAILTNHGQVTIGKTYDEAIQRAVFFELACQIIVNASEQIRPLAASAAEELMRSGVGRNV